MANGFPNFPPYTPKWAADGPGTDWDAPLSPEELAMATHIFRMLRQMAQIQYGPVDPSGGACAYEMTFRFDESMPPDARVHIHFRSDEPSSGYSDDGVGPDLGTALNCQSDDDETNGTKALPPYEAPPRCTDCEQEGIYLASTNTFYGRPLCAYHTFKLDAVHHTR